MSCFDHASAERLLQEVFAPWLQDLDLAVERIDGDGAILRMPFSDRLCRDNGVVCGQALMSLADTAMVFAVAAASGGYRPMTTIDQTTHFLCPIAKANVLAEARVTRLGRSVAFGRVEITAEGDTRLAVTAQTAYALLGEAR